jgi:hypothetical protein
MSGTQLTWINFVGICTHFRNPILHDPLDWRVVLVNASQNVIDHNPALHKFNICPHQATLELVPDQVVKIDGPAPFDANDSLVLDGVTLEILNSITALSNPDSTDCMPQLSLLKSNVSAGPAVTSADPKSVACYFDLSFSAGRLRSTLMDGACALLFTTTTLGDTRLRITPFGGGTSTTVTLRNHKLDDHGHRLPVYINVANRPIRHDNNPEHFLLHYLAADSIPASMRAITISGCDQNPSVGLNFLKILAEGPGCSNGGLSGH